MEKFGLKKDRAEVGEDAPGLRAGPSG